MAPGATRLAELPALLSRLRAGPHAWGEVSVAAEGEGATWVDAHARARYGALVGLQHDRQPGDLALVMHLLQQEIESHRQSPLGGLEESLKLAAYLAAELSERSLELPWVMLEAKQLNFDTACGFDVEALMLAGIERTWAMVQASSHPLREAFLEELDDGEGNPRCTQDDVDRWWALQRRWFPARWEDEAPLARLSTCVALGDHAEGEAELRRWLADALASAPPGGPEERDVLEQARSWWRDLGRPDEAARAQARIDALLPDEAWSRASALQTSVGTYAAAGAIEAGLERLPLLRAALDRVDRWYEYGLGRLAAEVAVDLALAARDDAQARQALAWAEDVLAAGTGRSLVLLEKLQAITARLGLDARAQAYAAAAQAERERIALT